MHDNAQDRYYVTFSRCRQHWQVRDRALSDDGAHRIIYRSHVSEKADAVAEFLNTDAVSIIPDGWSLRPVEFLAADLRECLLLVLGEGCPSEDKLAEMTLSERAAIADWAADMYLAASENSVEPARIPEQLNALLPDGHFYKNWGWPCHAIDDGDDESGA